MKRRGVHVVTDKKKNKIAEKLPSLLEAVKNRSPHHLIKKIINLGADLEERDEDGKTALMFAVVYSDLALFQQLISAGADIRAVDATGSTVLMIAVTHASGEIVIAVGAPLVLACKENCFNMVKILLNIPGASSVSVQNKRGKSPLMIATAQGCPEMIKILLSAGADVNAIDDKGETALFKFQNEKSLQLLLQAGAKPNAENDCGASVLMSLLLRSPPRLGSAKLLIQAGVADPSAHIVNGVTPLMYFCMDDDKERVDVVKFLLDEAGARNPLFENDDLCALTSHHSISNGYTETLRLLLAAGVSPSQTIDDTTLLELVCISVNNFTENQDVEMINLLIEAGADLNTKRHILSFAALTGRSNVVKHMIEVIGLSPTRRSKISVSQQYLNTLQRFQREMFESLFMAFWFCQSTVLSLLLPFCSSPPLGLYILPCINSYMVSRCIEFHPNLAVFNTLLEIGGPLPPGHDFIICIQNYLDSLPGDCEHAKEISKKFKQTHREAPPSLRQLCRHVIRDCVHGGDDLPQRLSSLVPPGLKSFLTLME